MRAAHSAARRERRAASETSREYCTAAERARAARRSLRAASPARASSLEIFGSVSMTRKRVRWYSASLSAATRSASMSPT